MELAPGRQVRTCLAYVLNNWRHHREHLGGVAQRRARLDPYSTAIRFDGWLTPTGRFPSPDGYEPLLVASPTTWLLTTGWRLHALLDPYEVPGAPRPLAHRRRSGPRASDDVEDLDELR